MIAFSIDNLFFIQLLINVCNTPTTFSAFKQSLSEKSLRPRKSRDLLVSFEHRLRLPEGKCVMDSLEHRQSGGSEKSCYALHSIGSTCLVLQPWPQLVGWLIDNLVSALHSIYSQLPCDQKCLLSECIRATFSDHK